MASPTTEVAAATLDHSERIRRLTERMDAQRRTVSKLSLFVGFLVVIQVMELIPIALGDSSPFGVISQPMASGFARGLLFGVVIALVVSILFRKKLRAGAAWNP